MTPKLLIAEDNPDVASVVGFAARMNWPGCEVTIAATGEEALRRFEEGHPDLVVLDVSMPPPDGLEVCRRIREISRVPILMLTIRKDTLDKVRALDLGADDYLTKPFDHLELLARLRALLRRSSEVPSVPGPDFSVGDFSIRFGTRDVRLGGEPVSLTSTEYELLEQLVRHAGTVLPHGFLAERVWGAECGRDNQSLKVFVGQLRRKLGDDPDNPRYIHTVWGTGYRFVSPA